MKALLVLARITLVGCLWSIVFIEGIRVIVLENWRFDIFWLPHWSYAWSLWQSGWVIDTPKEWAFILILLTFIPLWLTGWIALSLIPWERLIYNIIAFPFRLLTGTMRPLTQVVNPTPVVVKRKSYKEVRPTGRRMPISDYKVSSNATTPVLSAPISSPSYSASKRDSSEAMPDTLSHSVFNLDDEDNAFDLDIDSFEQSDIFKIDSNKKTKDYSSDDEFSKEEQKPLNQVDKHFSEDDFDEEDDDLDDYEPAPRMRREPRRYEQSERREPRDQRRSKNKFEKEEDFSRNRQRRAEPSSDRRERRDTRKEKSSSTSERTIGDILFDKGYDIVRNISVKNMLVDYVAVSADRVLLCIMDKETGDWLADEERFNDEEPLWFSENAHRISPVRTIDLARQSFEKVFSDSEFDVDVEAFVIVINGNIINAEDMFDAWNELNVKVVRHLKGKPNDLPPFAQVVPPAQQRFSADELVAFKKMMKKLI